MKIILYLIVIIFFIQNNSYTLNNEKLNRLKYKAKNKISKLSIQKYCSKEDPGIEIDSAIGEQIMFGKKCKCAIKSGETESEILAKNILDICSL